MAFFAGFRPSARSSSRSLLRLAAPPALVVALAFAWPACSPTAGGLAGLNGASNNVLAGAGGGSASSSSGSASSGAGGKAQSSGSSSSGASSSGIVCGPGTSLCDKTCAALQNDPANCGACGTACKDGKVCDKGKCALECTGGATLCGASCLDVNTDPANCGACGKACAAGEVCDTGKCALECVGGTSACNGACVDLTVDTANCGTCGNLCPAGDRCDGSACVAITCSGGTLLCTSVCTYVAIDPNNCGSCGNVCPAGPNSVSTCQKGVCGQPCTGTWANCDNKGDNGCEIDLSSDPQHCGACGTVCPAIAHGTPGCAHEACSVASCDAGFDDCDGDPANGCEADLANNSKHCGTCGVACVTGAACSAGGCAQLRRVFVSSAVYSGDLGGLAGADAKCQGLADAAMLGGTFLAWLSDASTPASAHLAHWAGKYALVDGTVVASSWMELTSGALQTAISVNESGQPGPLGTASCGFNNVLPVTWTGTSATGSTSKSGDACSNWTSASASGHVGEMGNFLLKDAQWTNYCPNSNCSVLAPIYCVEQ